MSADKANDVANLPPTSDERLSPEQQKEKAEVVKAAVKKIKTWFNYHHSLLGLNSSENPWIPLLNKVHQINDAPSHQPSNAQFYMNMDKFKPLCDSEFEKVWPTLGLSQDYIVSNWVKTAKRLLEDELPEVQKQVHTLVMKAHAKVVKDFKKGLWVSDNLDLDAQAQ
ncbi:hypothetical protein BDN71DRAFT_1507562 [Pleurotus eryngii]|uniref:Uncharacterized protein n=1 Tax=Pleurotus eryngii TaxID=5323 RepID=A0A9P5ZVE8_PLEER|nr:hypothetical protein BDN71DRAFT_1507562 [Pleurotus eryngii]